VNHHHLPPTTSDTNNSDFNLLNEDFKSDDFIMTQSFMANNPLVSSFYNHQYSCQNNYIDKTDQSTQTE
jgi:hypothetical protein